MTGNAMTTTRSRQRTRRRAHHARLGDKRGVTTTKASWVDDAFARALPRSVNQARRSMEFFDGPFGAFAAIVPWTSRPKTRAPDVDKGEGVVFDFATMGLGDFENRFSSLNDVVMGGRSDADVVLKSGDGAVMSGVTENQFGGFASFKCRDFERALDLSSYDGLKLTCAAKDGFRYKVIAYDSEDSFNVAFHQTFECPKEMGEVKLKFSEFVPVKRGRAVSRNDPEYRTFDGSKIVSLQFMLSKFDYGMENLNTNYKPGAFEFRLRRVEAYKN